MNGLRPTPFLSPQHLPFASTTHPTVPPLAARQLRAERSMRRMPDRGDSMPLRSGSGHSAPAWLGASHADVLAWHLEHSSDGTGCSYKHWIASGLCCPGSLATTEKLGNTCLAAEHQTGGSAEVRVGGGRVGGPPRPHGACANCTTAVHCVPFLQCAKSKRHF
ncbi:unnamed protein product, partial [Iphiclides podalirius]